MKGKFAFATGILKNTRTFSRAESTQKSGEMSTPYLYKYEKTIST